MTRTTLALALFVAVVASAPSAARAQTRVVVKGTTYVTGRSLGGGRWARVVEARPENGKGPAIAIKLATRRDPSQPEGNTFRREARVMQLVEGKHSSLPQRAYGLGKVIGTGEDVLAMELVDAEQLPYRMKPREAIDVTMQLLDGVGQLHRVGLWHADITPGNVLRDQHGRVYLLDFGRTREFHEPREGSGWPGFSAPEVSDRSYRRGDLQDIYSIGRVLRHTLSAVPPELEPIVAKATHRDPGQRFQKVDEFRAALVKARDQLDSRRH